MTKSRLMVLNRFVTSASQSTSSSLPVIQILRIVGHTFCCRSTQWTVGVVTGLRATHSLVSHKNQATIRLKLKPGDREAVLLLKFILSSWADQSVSISSKKLYGLAISTSSHVQTSSTVSASRQKTQAKCS